MAIVVGSVVGFVLVLKFEVLDLLINPFYQVMGESERLKFFSPTEPFFLILKVGILGGVILVSPIWLYQLWAFLSPALERHEKRLIIPSLCMGLVLFSAGIAMSYYLALPVTLRFLLFFGEDYFDMMLQAGPYLGFVTSLLLAFGLMFELPVVIMILSALGLVTPTFLRRMRRHAIVIITVAASVMSPGDMVTLTIMMVAPLIVLYEFSILLSVMVYRRREGREIGGEPPDEAAPAR